MAEPAEPAAVLAAVELAERPRKTIPAALSASHKLQSDQVELVGTVGVSVGQDSQDSMEPAGSLPRLLPRAHLPVVVVVERISTLNTKLFRAAQAPIAEETEPVVNLMLLLLSAHRAEATLVVEAEAEALTVRAVS
jgi:hypothetical protein